MKDEVVLLLGVDGGQSHAPAAAHRGRPRIPPAFAAVPEAGAVVELGGAWRTLPPCRQHLYWCFAEHSVTPAAVYACHTPVASRVCNKTVLSAGLETDKTCVTR